MFTDECCQRKILLVLSSYIALLTRQSKFADTASGTGGIGGARPWQLACPDQPGSGRYLLADFLHSTMACNVPKHIIYAPVYHTFALLNHTFLCVNHSLIYV